MHRRGYPALVGARSSDETFVQIGAIALRILGEVAARRGVMEDRIDHEAAHMTAKTKVKLAAKAWMAMAAIAAAALGFASVWLWTG
jgi:hypothetical protein